MIKKIIKEIFKCHHKTAIMNSNEGYCPDCGKYVRKSYYIVRCDCCGVKRNGKKHFGDILPSEKYCTNCGSTGYTIERYEKLNLVDINYAIEAKETAKEFAETENIEIWIEESKNNVGEKTEEDFMLLPDKKLKLITGE